MTGNHGEGTGGMALNAQLDAVITVLDTTIDQNKSKTLTGGISAFARSGGSIQIFDTTISNNRSIQTTNPNSGYGGGMRLNNDGGSITIDQSTVSTNFADTDGGGIQVDNLTDGAVVIRRSTITQNTSDADSNLSGNGGGILVSRGTVNLDHTIVAGNHDNSGIAPDVAGIVNANRSLIGSGGNLLGPLADNGGPTMTHALLSGSPAINAGDPAAVAGANGVPVNDQRGAPLARVYGRHIDIGAYESQPIEHLAGDFNLDGTVDAADYPIVRKQSGSSFAPGTGADANGDGRVNEADMAVWKANFGLTQAHQHRA